MKNQKRILLLLAAIIFAAMIAHTAQAQEASPNKTYGTMTRGEQSAFVAAQARLIARRMSNTEYEFTPAFTAEIGKAVDVYARRIGNDGGDRLWKGDARFVFERGQTYAPALIAAFKKRNVPTLIGLYIPLIESEYVNIQSPNSVGALGMFQFLPQTGARYGLTAQELLDVEKSADAAARYINQNLARFKNDSMKEALALLAYNRGEGGVERDLAAIVNEQNKACSICALTAARNQLDETFQNENVYYVPRFFAAAIIGENPQSFSLQTQPLSTLKTKR